MKHPRIDDEHVVDRYLANELSDEEVEAFEEHLFECAACLEAVEWGDELRRGVRAVAANAHPDSAFVDGSVDGLPEEIRSVSKPWLASPTGRGVFAALAVAFLALGFVAIRQSAEIKRLQQDPPDVIAGFIEPTADFQVASLGVVRSGDVAEIRLAPSRSAVLLSLELPEVAAATYRVTLYDGSDQIVWQGDGLEPSLYDTLMVAVPSSFLATGEYRLDVLADESTKPASPVELRFRVAP